jgi:3-methyladenine DNA glycosylase Tag
MDHHQQPKPPRDLAGYLEAMTRIVFSSGMSWRVVEAKWPGIREAFHDFEPERVARMTGKDVDRLAKDTRVIRNVPKLEATVLNAKEVVAIGKASGGFKGYLRSLGPASDAAAALRKRFRYLGDHGTYYFLWSVGQPVPSREEWGKPSTPKAAATPKSGATRPAAKPAAKRTATARKKSTSRL